MTGLKLFPLVYWLSMALVPIIVHGSSDYSDRKTSLKIIVGGYQPQVHLLEYNPTTQNFHNITTSPSNSTGSSPSFIGFSPDGRFFFTVNEVSDFRGLNQTGSVSSFEIINEDKIRPISTGLTGADPVSLAVSPNGRNLIAADTGGSWSRFAVNHLGKFTSLKPIQVHKYHGSGPIKERQDHSFLHQVVYNKAGDLVFFVDLGGDSVYIHRVDRWTGQVGEIAHEIKFPAGTTPRHLSLVERGKEYDIYLISELSNQIFTIRLTDEYGLKSTIRQTLSTLPHSVTNTTTYGAGEVMVSRDQRFVYGSNRQTDFSKPITDNSIVMFKRDLHTGLLIENSTSSPAWFPITVGGKTPRHFSFSNDYHQSLMIVGCQQSDTILIFHRFPQNGHLKLLSSTPVLQPTVQFFLPDKHTHY